MRRVAAAILVAACLLPSAPATAQDEPVRLVLFSMTPYVTADRPLVVQVGAVNPGGTAYRDLSLTLQVSSAVVSRSELEQTLGSESLPLDAANRRLEGPLEAGASRSFQPMEMALGDLGLSGNGLLPVTAVLRANGGFTTVAVLHTAVVYVGEEVKFPLNVALCFVLDEPIRIRSDGALIDDTLERSIAPGGRLETMVAALEAVPVPVTLVVSPLLLDELRRMSGGYRVVDGDETREVPADADGAEAAARMVNRIAAIARRAGGELVALPYASPSVPALATAGLADDLRAQIDRGREVVRSVLQIEPSTTVFRPPGSAISSGSLGPLLDVLDDDGTVETLLLDAGLLEPSAADPYTPATIAQVASREGALLRAIDPDPVVEERTQGVPEDPRLAATWAVAELSALYFEQPSLLRGAAVVFGEEETPSAEFLVTFLEAFRPVAGVTWLGSASATRVLEADTEPADHALEVRDLHAPRTGTLTDTFVAELTETREGLDALVSAETPQDLIAGIGRNIMLSESRYLLPRQDLAVELLTASQRAVQQEFEKILPPVNTSITLTSRSGTIPITLRNEAGYPIKVSLTLRASGLRFLDGGRQEVDLEQPQQRIVFPVRARATGRFPVLVEVDAPNGTPIASSTIVVRSTAYNRVALVVTIGAALFLLFWWGRRLLPRRRG